MQAASYAMIEDEGLLPKDLTNVCGNQGHYPLLQEVIIEAISGNSIATSEVSKQCGIGSTCIVPSGITLKVDSKLNVGALVVRGVVEWNDSTQVEESVFLCAGYFAVEEHGQWHMNLQEKNAFLYIKDNGAEHEHLRTRAFGSYANATLGKYTIIDINGRELDRTWSLLASPLRQGGNKITLMHNPKLMGW